MNTRKEYSVMSIEDLVAKLLYRQESVKINKCRIYIV